MTAGELGKIVELAVGFGVRKIKLTGGEPLLREDIVEVVAAAAKPKIEEVSLTTNGTLLAGITNELAAAGLNRVNISLDTLDDATYERITGEGLLRDVLAGIDAALDAGLTPVKLNMVLLAGVNEHEVERMIAYASKRGIILQLIELLDAGGKNFAVYHRGLDAIEQSLRERAVAVQTRRSMQARRKYILPSGEVEVVKPMHNSEFCMHCTRLRLTPDGHLKPCLMRNDNLVDLLPHISAGDLKGARDAFAEAIARREPYFKGAAREICVSHSV
jgi:cyclic pyranopterin phosphate synthase